jgi:hypothetical protein
MTSIDVPGEGQLKLRFALEIEDGWPPVAIEGIWCATEDSVFRAENAPFFIYGLAFGDRFTASPDSVNGLIHEFSVVAPSGHSLIWALPAEPDVFAGFRRELIQTGCRIEGLQQFSLYAIDVPGEVKADDINPLVDRIERAGVPLAFPVWRHDCP